MPSEKLGHIRHEKDVALLLLDKGHEADMKVYMVLLLHRNNDPKDPEYGTAYPSEARICEMAKLKRRAVQYAIKNLQEWGLIAVRKRERKGGGWKHNVYYLG
jgi:predicted transcriptional regulator